MKNFHIEYIHGLNVEAADHAEAEEKAREYWDDNRPTYDDLLGVYATESKDDSRLLPDFVVEVSGGVAEITKQPEHMRAIIIDHDNMELSAMCSEKGCGGRLRELEDWEIESRELLPGACVCLKCGFTYGEGAVEELQNITGGPNNGNK